MSTGEGGWRADGTFRSSRPALLCLNHSGNLAFTPPVLGADSAKLFLDTVVQVGVGCVKSNHNQGCAGGGIKEMQGISP